MQLVYWGLRIINSAVSRPASLGPESAACDETFILMHSNAPQNEFAVRVQTISPCKERSSYA